ncbi:MAG: hypothetical protein RJA07_378 [Bacteroidota bacterium]|jgi:DNA protecting protein DprA
MTTNNFIFNLLRLKGIGNSKANKMLFELKGLLNTDIINSAQLKIELSNYLLNSQIEELFSNSHTDEYVLSQKIFYQNKFHGDFPFTLKNIGDKSPTILSLIGNKQLLNSKKIGFCGSREASEKGLSIAKDIAQQVTKENITVVSGYASGIDQETHYWALKEGGKTIIVLPQGINGFTIKKYIKEVWDWERVLVISEFLPESIWSVGNAMQRNLTIIGLSDVMILIEAKEKGGSIDAGYKTLNLNKKLFAPVYNGMPVEALGNQILLTKGALPLLKNRNTERANIEKILTLL